MFLLFTPFPAVNIFLLGSNTLGPKGEPWTVDDTIFAQCSRKTWGGYLQMIVAFLQLRLQFPRDRIYLRYKVG